MLIHNKKVVIYDIEVFPNVFSCTCKDTETEDIFTYELSLRKSQLKELVEFFTQKDILLAGYNNHHYDDVVMNYIIEYCDRLNGVPVLRATDSIFKLSNTVIQAEEGDTSRFKQWKYANTFSSMDILTMMFSSKLRVGLKEMQLTMHYPNVLEFHGDFNKPLRNEEIDEMIQYNVNDVESTFSLFKTLVNKGEVDLRLFLEEEYGFNALSMDSVKFGETLLLRECSKAMGISPKELKDMRSPMDYIPLKDVILPIISYKNPKLRDVLEEMKEQIVYSRERKGYEKKFVLSDTQFSVGVGGIHSLNEPKIFVPKEDEYIGHLDVASMYPSFIVQYGWFPRHLGKAGLDVYVNLYKERLEAKHNGQKLKNLALKLVLNSVTGKMQQETSWMYDPFSVFKIRINGQLVLLMLVDILLQHNCKIVQVNTDGVMFIGKKEIENHLQESVIELEQITKLTFEGHHYEAFYQYAVNDYFGIIEGFSQSRDQNLIERKGMFITDTKLGKGLTPTIIPEAVIKYFTEGIPIEKTIRECTDIRKFMMGQRIDKKFSVEYGGKPIQRINRFYASTKGIPLLKVKKENNKLSYTNLLTKSGVVVLNKYDDTDIKCRSINYGYYTSEARTIVENLRCRQLSLFD